MKTARCCEAKGTPCCRLNSHKKRQYSQNSCISRVSYPSNLQTVYTSSLPINGFRFQFTNCLSFTVQNTSHNAYKLTISNKPLLLTDFSCVEATPIHNTKYIKKNYRTPKLKLNQQNKTSPNKLEKLPTKKINHMHYSTNQSQDSSCAILIIQQITKNLAFFFFVNQKLSLYYKKNKDVRKYID